MEGVMRRYLALLAVLVASAGCSSGASDAAPAELPGEPVAKGLCRAAEAGAGNPETAEESFVGIHSDLHVVARALQEEDRKAAARLLVAKQRVEDDFRRGAPASELTPDLRRLLTATRDGLARLHVTVAPCDG
jgi:membrane-bound lytic murein transglycosylase B